MKNANLFGILWLIVGLAHFGIILIIEASNVSIGADALLYYSIFLLPLRFLLIENVLGLRLDSWLKWTVIGTIVGAIAAAAYIGVGFVVLIICCMYRSPGDSIIPALFVLGFYPLFRLVLLMFQMNVPKLGKNSWVLGNIPGIFFVWFAFAYLFTYSSEPALGGFLTFVALAISELVTANRLILVKARELLPEKRKVEDLLIL